MFFVSFFVVYAKFCMADRCCGNQTIRTDQVEDLAKSLGLHTDAYLHNINFKQIQPMEMEPDIAWITVNHNKTKVVIELCKSTKIPNMEGDDTPGNLVAKRRRNQIYEIYSVRKL